MPKTPRRARPPAPPRPASPTTRRRRGARFEAAVVEHLRHTWPDCERRKTQGAKDRGDVAGIPGWIVECKSGQGSLGAFMTEAQLEARNAEAHSGNRHRFAVVMRRRNHPVADAFAIVPLSTWIELVSE